MYISLTQTLLVALHSSFEFSSEGIEISGVTGDLLGIKALVIGSIVRGGVIDHTLLLVKNLKSYVIEHKTEAFVDAGLTTHRGEQQLQERVNGLLDGRCLQQAGLRHI